MSSRLARLARPVRSRPAARGFTLIELAICLTVLALLVPLLFALQTTLESGHAEAGARLEAARAARTVSEELRRDGRTMRVVAGGFEGACGKVAWDVAGGVLLRRGGAACGGDRALARNVRSFDLSPDGAKLVLALDVGRGVPVIERFEVAFAGSSP